MQETYSRTAYIASMGNMQCVGLVLDHKLCIEKFFWGYCLCVDAFTVWNDLKEQYDKVSGS